MPQSLSNFYVVFYLVFHRLSWVNFHLLLYFIFAEEPGKKKKERKKRRVTYLLLSLNFIVGH